MTPAPHCCAGSACGTMSSNRCSNCLATPVKAPRSGGGASAMLSLASTNSARCTNWTASSYTGFFAKTDLYEVKKAETKEVNMLDQAWFVSKEDLSQYDAKTEIVYDDETGHAKVYPLGTFIYRLNGRSRQKSASYYTPEVLTKCVVKYALKEILVGKKPDEILQLTVCEPALGSGAFLNEAINQLAEAYLEGKQAELKRRIPESDLEQERQKVKAFLADNRVFGVDQNPVAVELAEISLWLNTIYQGHTIPWFRRPALRLGNSLICVAAAKCSWARAVDG